MEFTQFLRDNGRVTLTEAATWLGFNHDQDGLRRASNAIKLARKNMAKPVAERVCISLNKKTNVSNFIHYTKYDPLAVKAYEDFLNSLPKNRRRALELSAEGSHTKEEWLDLCNRTGNVCLRCGIAGLPLTVDHIVPLSKGGSHFIQNLQPLCRSCNSIKGVQQTDYRPVLTPLA